MQAMPQKAKVKYRSSLQGTVVVAGNSIPRKGMPGVPPYKSWSYLMQNELANETGGRIFYTDATGVWLLCLHGLCHLKLAPLWAFPVLYKVTIAATGTALMGTPTGRRDHPCKRQR